jgi:malonate transporter
VNYAQLLLPDFTLILFGHLVCRYTTLNRSVWQPVESLVYYLLFPVLLFQSNVRSPVDIGAASGLMQASRAPPRALSGQATVMRYHHRFTF